MGWYLSRRLAVLGALAALIVLAPVFLAEDYSSTILEESAPERIPSGNIFITRGPYLQQPTPTSIKVLWRTDISSDARVRYGDAPGNLTDQVDDLLLQIDHSVELTGLDPETRYYYSIGYATEVLAGDDSTHFFATPPTFAPSAKLIPCLPNWRSSSFETSSSSFGTRWSRTSNSRTSVPYALK